MVKKLVGIVVIVVMLFGVFGITGCGDKETPQERIKRISGVSIPIEAEIVYNYIGDTFSGRSPQYTVFKFEEEPTDFFTSDFSYGGELYTKVDGKEIYKPVISGTLSFVNDRMQTEDESEIKQRLERWCIPNEHAPKWENKYTYYVQRDTNILYFTESKILIFENQGY